MHADRTIPRHGGATPAPLRRHPWTWLGHRALPASLAFGSDAVGTLAVLSLLLIRGI